MSGRFGFLAAAVFAGIAALQIQAQTTVAGANGILAANPRANDLPISAGHGNSPFIPARVVAADSGGRTFGIVVPAGSPISLSVYSSALALADQTGTAFVTKAVSIPLRASQTATSTGRGVPATPTVPLQVTGLAAAMRSTGATGVSGATSNNRGAAK